MSLISLQPHWSEPPQPFRHTWEEVVNVDQFRWLVRHDLLEQLSRVQRELGARHIRAVGMFDDEIRVLCPGPETFGAPDPRPVRCNWQIVDYVCDELLERGLAPMITTSFIPSRLASGPVTVFTTKGHTSPPRDHDEWADLVEAAVRHLAGRYGTELLRSWWFEVWNEPNLAGWFWGGDQKDFWKLWQATWTAIKRVDPALRVGGPSTAGALWMEEFLAFTRREGCPPDYLTLHIYNNDGAAPLAPFAGPQSEKLGTSADHVADVVRASRRQAQSLGFGGPIHFNEWGRSWRPVEPDRESANEAAFIVRAMAAVSQEADVFAYWCVSDIYDQVGYGREAFHGNYGLLSLQGLRKPAYHAFALLHQLGTMRVPVSGGDESHGAIATVQGQQADVLVYAYRHDPQTPKKSLRVEVALPPGATGECTLHRIASRENNVVTRWRDLGAPDYLRPEERRALAAVDELQEASELVAVTSGPDGLKASFNMESPGVARLRLILRDQS